MAAQTWHASQGLITYTGVNKTAMPVCHTMSSQGLRAISTLRMSLHIRHEAKGSNGMPHAHLLNGAQLVERLALQALHQQGSQGIPPQVIRPHLPQRRFIAL